MEFAYNFTQNSLSCIRRARSFGASLELHFVRGFCAHTYISRWWISSSTSYTLLIERASKWALCSESDTHACMCGQNERCEREFNTRRSRKEILYISALAGMLFSCLPPGEYRVAQAVAKNVYVKDGISHSAALNQKEDFCEFNSNPRVLSNYSKAAFHTWEIQCHFPAY